MWVGMLHGQFVGGRNVKAPLFFPAHLGLQPVILTMAYFLNSHPCIPSKIVSTLVSYVSFHHGITQHSMILKTQLVVFLERSL
jgi:hypothetical protein